MLSLLVHTQSLRFAFPAFILVGVSPHFMLSWLALRLVTAVLPGRFFQRIDENLYDAYQSLVVYFFETYAGTQVILYGDDFPCSRKENVIYICNHQSSVDWVVADMLAIRQGVLGRIRYILKNGLKYLPLYGFYFAMHGCMYVKKGGKRNDEWISRCLKSFIRNKTPFWLVIFPEGTRYNINKPKIIQASQKYSIENDLPVLEHVLNPRARATQIAMRELSPYMDAIYDITIAFKDSKRPLLPKQEGPSLTEFLSYGNREIHIHLQRIEGGDIPKGDDETKKWLYQQFAEKDRLLSYFYGEENDGKFPGDSKTINLKTRRTLPYFIIWGGLLALTVSSKKGRSLYLKSWLITGLASILYMGAFH